MPLAACDDENSCTVHQFIDEARVMVLHLQIHFVLLFCALIVYSCVPPLGALGQFSVAMLGCGVVTTQPVE